MLETGDRRNGGSDKCRTCETDSQAPRFARLSALFSVFLLVGCGSTDHKLYQKADNLWRNKRYEEAVKLYERTFTRYPRNKLADTALFEAANIYYYNLRRVNRAMELYRKLLDEYPQSSHAIEARWRLGEIYELEVGDFLRALGEWEAILRQLPQGRKRLEALQRLGDCYLRFGERPEDLDHALLCYLQIAHSGQSGHLSDQANLKIGNIYQMQKKYKASLEPFLQVQKETGCKECRYAAQRGLIESYELLRDYERAIDMAKQLEVPPSTTEYKEATLRRLRLERSRSASLRARKGSP